MSEEKGLAKIIDCSRELEPPVTAENYRELGYTPVRGIIKSRNPLENAWNSTANLVEALYLNASAYIERNILPE